MNLRVTCDSVVWWGEVSSEKDCCRSRDRGLNKLSRSHHQSGVQSCCWLSVSSLICVNWLVGHATFLLTIRLKWHNSIVISLFQSINNVRLLTNSLSSFWCDCQPGRGNHSTEYESDLRNKEHHYSSKKKKKAHMVSKLLTSLIPMQSFTNWANKHYC